MLFGKKSSARRAPTAFRRRLLIPRPSPPNWRGVGSQHIHCLCMVSSLDGRVRLNLVDLRLDGIEAEDPA
jgi:hypothetical protein